MRRLTGLFLALGLLYGCSDGGVLPYAPNNLSQSQLQSFVTDAASHSGVAPALINAVIMAESAGNPAAVSRVGAEGLMQLMPSTAGDCGVTNAFDPQQNIECGSQYLHSLLERYNNNVELAVAAYNAGPAAVDQYHGVPPYAETQAYVTRVLSDYRNY